VKENINKEANTTAMGANMSSDERTKNDHRQTKIIDRNAHHCRSIDSKVKTDFTKKTMISA